MLVQKSDHCSLKKQQPYQSEGFGDFESLKLHGDSISCQGLEQFFVDGIGRDQPQMTALFWFVLRLYGYVCIDGSAVVLSIELIVHFSNGRIEEGEGGIDGQLDERDCCSFDKLNLRDPSLS